MITWFHMYKIIQRQRDLGLGDSEDRRHVRWFLFPQGNRNQRTRGQRGQTRVPKARRASHTTKKKPRKLSGSLGAGEKPTNPWPSEQHSGTAPLDLPTPNPAKRSASSKDPPKSSGDSPSCVPCTVSIPPVQHHQPGLGLWMRRYDPPPNPDTVREHVLHAPSLQTSAGNSSPQSQGYTKHLPS